MEYLVTFFVWIVYLIFQATSIYGGDSGELVAAAFTAGIAHPPGYPLFMFLGNLVSRLPWGTVAWRIALLSSLPSAVSLFFLGKTISFLTKRRALGILGMITAAFLYPNWLYAVVPEVFGLWALFSSVLLYLAVRLIAAKEDRYAYWISLISGLALTHHHMIVILLVIIALTCRYRIKHTARMLAFFVLGLLPYLYAPIASSGNPLFDWEHPASLGGFIRLVSRASYGPFRASYATGLSVMDRILGVATVAHFTREDFGWMGMALIAVGSIAVFVRFKPYVPLLLGYTAVLLAFFFYAGFPVGTDFALGTLERFMVVLYQQFVLLFVLGLWGVLHVVSRVGKSMNLLPVAVIGIGFLLPIRLFGMNYHRLVTIRTDRTMEKLADDIFKSVPEGSILSLDTDTSINAAAFSHYVLGMRPDIAYISFPLLQYPVYRKQIKKRFPRLIIPENHQHADHTYLALFIKENAEHVPIASGNIIVDIPEHWVPRGLVMLYYPTADAIPDRDRILEENLALFAGFFDPTAAFNARYHHLLLGDVIAQYDDRRLILAQALALQGRYGEAKDQVVRVLVDYPRTPRYYTTIIKLLLSRKRCAESMEILSRLETRPFEGDESLPLFYETYKMCAREGEAFRRYEDVYRSHQSRFDTLFQ